MEKIIHGSANVFADLGFPDAAERQAKLKLAKAINDIIIKRKLTPTQSANLLEIDQLKISALANYKLKGVSVERLMRFLMALGRDVEIVICKPKKQRKESAGHGAIRVAAD